jgi:hypothetical protein
LQKRKPSLNKPSAPPYLVCHQAASMIASSDSIIHQYHI